MKLTNCGCFENLTLEFSDKINLLIGDNATGKTTIIEAINAALFLYHSNFNPSKNIEYKCSGFERYNSSKALPVFRSFFSTDVEKSLSTNIPMFKMCEQERSFGYLECFEKYDHIDLWKLRLQSLKNSSDNQLEIDGVRKTIFDVFGIEGCNIISDIDNNYINITLSDGRIIDIAYLSSGLKRLLSIVLDISFRCMILNKEIFGIDAPSQTEGTVLIDDIDIHLYPKIQPLIIKGLQRAFPKIQFIISTNSPLVMSSVPVNDDNKIIKLEYNRESGYTAKEIDVYGLDVSTITQNILGVTARSQDVEKELNQLFSLIDEDQYEAAAIKLGQLKSQFGDKLPELSKAQAMLDLRWILK